MIDMIEAAEREELAKHLEWFVSEQSKSLENDVWIDEEKGRRIVAALRQSAAAPSPVVSDERAAFGKDLLARAAQLDKYEKLPGIASAASDMRRAAEYFLSPPVQAALSVQPQGVTVDQAMHTEYSDAAVAAFKIMYGDDWPDCSREELARFLEAQTALTHRERGD